MGSAHMRKFNKKEIFRNVGSSWVALGVNVLVGIFLSPFILHRLGDEAFGLWVLIFSVTGYYGLFDLGIRSSIIRYVSKYTAVDDRVQLNGLINTALFSYSGVGLLCLAITAAGSFYVDSIFKVPASFLSTARLLFLMVGTLEPRKGHRVALDAFTALWRNGFAGTLCIIGKRGWALTSAPTCPARWKPFPRRSRSPRRRCS